MSTTRAPWSVTVLMAVGTLVAMLALSTLLDGGGWLRTVAFVIAISCAADLAVRAATRSRFLPSAAALVAAVFAMIPLFAIKEDGTKHLLPTPSAVTDLWHAITEGASYAASTPAPATVTVELSALITAFAVAIFIVSDHLAASWKAVALSGIVLMLPWTPAIFLQYQVPMWALFATAACWMIAMGAVRSSAASNRAVPLTGAIIASTAALLVAVIVAPAAVGGNGWGAIPRFNAPSSLDTSTRLNLALDLRNSLTVNSSQVVFTYVSTGQHPPALRLYTLRDFDGVTWTREKDDANDLIPAASSGVLWSEEVKGWDDLDHVILSIDLKNSAERNLPLPTFPRSVDTPDNWQYSSSRDEVTTAKGSSKGLQYSVVTSLDYFTEESLKDSQAAIDLGKDPVSAIYTEIPTSVDIGRITSLARDITKDSATQFDEAVALQNYLRDSNNFTYDTSVEPVRSGDAVSQFLDSKHGYCVHFATTMVMLARSLGIPARMGLGYLGGQLSDDGVWQVLGGDAHTWPELYFPGQGWVRFEPTPAVQTGSAPSYTLENNGSGNAPIPSNVPIPTTVPSNNPQNPVPTSTAVISDGKADAGVPWWALAVVVILVLGAAYAVWMLRRRSVAHAAAHGPEAAWESLREHLPEPLRWSRSLTPIEAASRLEHELDVSSSALDEHATQALHELRDAVSDHRYAPPGDEGDGPSQEWLTERVNVVAAQANEALRSRSDRVDARSAPRHDS
jgi:transglutaminase-like putative cysteine protease